MRRIKFNLALFVAVSLLLSFSAYSATIEVSHPVQLTNSEYYERGQSIVFDGTYYWLFFGRSTGCTDPYSTGDPDVHDYEIYYKRAASVSGLAAAAAVKVTGTHNTTLYLGETDAAFFGGEVWVFGAYDAGTSCDLYAWKTTDGTSWTETVIATGMPDGAAHFAAAVCDGVLWVAYKIGGDWKSKYYDGSAWSSEYLITTNSGTAKFFVEGTSIYFVRADSGDQDIHEWDGSSWTMIDSATESGPYDPTIYKVGTYYVVAYAPWVSPKQWIKAKVGSSLSTLLSTGQEVMISGAEYEGNTWIDMWPMGFSDGSATYLFYTSERNPDDASSEIVGNIWYLEVDWDVTRDHYTYIQPAVGAASSGDVISLAVGTYEEQVEITKPLTLSGGGGGAGGCVILSPDVLTKYFSTSKDNYPIVFIHDTDDVTIENLTVDGAGKGNANYRFQGVGFNNAGGTVKDCIITGIIDTPFSGAQHGIGVASWNDDGVSRTINVWDCTFTDFQKNAIALNADDTTPLVVDVRRNTITGAGETGVIAQNGVQVWATMATGVVEDNVITGISYNGGGWVGTSILNIYADLTIVNNTITESHMAIYNWDGSSLIRDNDVTVKKIGGYCWGIAASDPPNINVSPFVDSEEGAGPGGGLKAALSTLDVDIIGNVVNFVGPDNTGTYGIEADAGYGPDNVDVTIKYNTVGGFEAGIEIFKCESDCDTGVFSSVVANYNNIGTGNTYGMHSNADYITSNGEFNWWGDGSGPGGEGSGSGAPVSPYIDYDPWMGAENIVRVVPDYGTTNCSTPVYFTFRVDRAGVSEEARGYNVTFSVDQAVVTVSDPNNDITEGDYLSSVGTSQLYVTDQGGGVYTVSCAILGGDTGATGSGDLFTVKLTPVAEGVSTIDVTEFKLRDLDNNDLPTVSMDGSVRIDCTVPTMEPIAEPEGGWYNMAPVFSNFGFDDDVNLERAEYRIDSGAWIAIFSGIDAAEWNQDGWTLPGFDGLSEGSHTVYFRVADDAGNWNGEGTPDTYSWQFYKDTTPPGPPTNFTARPGNNKVHLSWTNPTGDPTFVGVELRRVRWMDYPEYSTPAPSYPADETQGDFVISTPGEAYDDSITTGRDIYYYAAFSFDLAGNYSSFDPGAADRATSYWLGDVHPPYDGMVNSSDLVDFYSTFGVSEGGAGWNNECDFGPTDDNSSYGIPLPDDVVDFEDLMIFAMIYGKVGPLGASMLAEGRRSLEPLDELVGFELAPVSGSSTPDGCETVSVRLKNRATSLKGFRLHLDVPGGSVSGITRGVMFDGSENLFFGVTRDGNSTVDICVAALGVDVPITGSGEVARITFRVNGEEKSLRLSEIDVRDIGNRRFRVEVDEDYNPPFVPTAYDLKQNYPNPFNPVTNIVFDIVKAGRVRIDVFDASGRLVRTLLDEYRGAGRHSVVWDGRNNAGSVVPSGIYFYRINTGEFTATRKMILLR